MENLLKQTQDPLFSQIINQQHLADKILGYVYDGKHGVQRGYHENGQPSTEFNWKEGKLDGVARRWYENGQLLFEQNWEKNRHIGLQRWWYKNGDPECTYNVSVTEDGWTEIS